MLKNNSQDSAEKSVHSKDNVRGKRYCEIFILSGGLTGLTATVYNTMGCNECPEDQWKAIDTERLKKEFSAREVIMNGPRYFLMDKIGQSNAEPEKVLIGGIEMKVRGKLHVSLGEIMKGKSQPYKENKIERSTEYIFNKGSKVYKLLSPKHSYIMQSYSQIVDPDLSESDLENLQTRIKLPDGWEYKVVMLDIDLVLQTIDKGETFVIQDELQNTYQRID